MKAALYYPWIYLRGGAERLILEMIRRSGHQWTIFTNHYEPENTFVGLRELRVVRLSEIPVRRSLASVARGLATLHKQEVDLAAFDALVVVSEGVGNFFAPREDIARSCICLTPLKVAYDPVTRQRFFGSRRKPHYSAALDLYQRFERPMWKKYDRVFCISEEVRRRIAEANLVDRGRLEVLHPGVDLERFRPADGREGFFLVPGRIMWQKNIELAIAAWREFKPSPDSNSRRLVIAGMVDRKSEDYLRRLRRDARMRPDIVFIETPSEELLTRLYQSSLAVIFTASNEDWGFVPVEAMACGKPVIAVRRGGPLESVVEGVTGLLCDDAPDAFATAIRAFDAMTPDELDRYGMRARARAELFSWASFVSRVDSHVNDLATRPATPQMRGLKTDVTAIAK